MSAAELGKKSFRPNWKQHLTQALMGSFTALCPFPSPPPSALWSCKDQSSWTPWRKCSMWCLTFQKYHVVAIVKLLPSVLQQPLLNLCRLVSPQATYVLQIWSADVSPTYKVSNTSQSHIWIIQRVGTSSVLSAGSEWHLHFGSTNADFNPANKKSLCVPWLHSEVSSRYSWLQLWDNQWLLFESHKVLVFSLEKY